MQQIVMRWSKEEDGVEKAASCLASALVPSPRVSPRGPQPQLPSGRRSREFGTRRGKISKSSGQDCGHGTEHSFLQVNCQPGLPPESPLKSPRSHSWMGRPSHVGTKRLLLVLFKMKRTGNSIKGQTEFRIKWALCRSATGNESFSRGFSHDRS